MELNLAQKLAGMPKYGARVLILGRELTKVQKINGVQIYLDSGKYYFKYPKNEDTYICIGQVGVCDKLTLIENFAKIISALELHTENGSLVQGLKE